MAINHHQHSLNVPDKKIPLKTSFLIVERGYTKADDTILSIS